MALKMFIRLLIYRPSHHRTCNIQEHIQHMTIYHKTIKIMKYTSKSHKMDWNMKWVSIVKTQNCHFILLRSYVANSTIFQKKHIKDSQKCAIVILKKCITKKPFQIKPNRKGIKVLKPPMTSSIPISRWWQLVFLFWEKFHLFLTWKIWCRPQKKKTKKNPLQAHVHFTILITSLVTTTNHCMFSTLDKTRNTLIFSTLFYYEPIINNTWEKKSI
jgi:hypothetical protein